MSIKIGVIGLGILGGTYYHGYKYLGYDVKGYDKFKESDTKSIIDLYDRDVIMLCLPTICKPDGSPDLSPFEDVLPQLTEYEGIILVRSTMMPGQTNEYAVKYGLKKLIHCPEFLTEKNARMDFFHPSRILVGLQDGAYYPVTGGEVDKEKVLTMNDQQILIELFKHFDCPIYIGTAKETELAKVASNAFLAVKVTYANEMDAICKKDGLDWENVKRMMQDDKRLATHTHMTVTQEGGYSGMCLPKDTKQLIDHARKLGYEPAFFAEVDKSNDRFRHG